MNRSSEVTGRGIITGEGEGWCDTVVGELVVETASASINTGRGVRIECTVWR